MDIVETKVSTASKAKFDYAHDALGRRTNVVQTGEIFSRYLNGGLHTVFGYNDRSELTSAQTWQGTSLGDSTYPVAGRNYAYAFDNIGNRTSTSVDGSGPSYTTNNLNQYTQTNRYPGYTVTGLAPAAATVTVNGATATRQGEFFHHWVGAGAASTSVWWNLNIASSYGGAETRNTWTPASPQTYNYDLDGNLLTDDRWAYTWDAENRLIAMETIAAAYNAGMPRQRLEFAHDYLGRRVQKTVYSWNSALGAWDLVTRTRYLYDGWSLVAEYDFVTPNTLNLKRSYLWAAGGTSNPGSLLAITHASGTVHLPAYDGNGNLVALINKQTGAVEAAYEYDPFGNAIRATGAYATVNPFRFSTKYTDNETGLVYYGLRYYDPKNGRFLGRDPISEQGGLNLYAFVRNNPVNAWDYLGMGYNTAAVFGKEFSDAHTVEEREAVLRSLGYVQDATGKWHDPRDGGGGFFSKIWKPVVAIAVGVVTGGLVAAALGINTATLGAAVGLGTGQASAVAAASAAAASTATVSMTSIVMVGAAAGAASGAASAVLNGGDLGDALKGAALGGLIGGITAGVLPGGGAARGSLEVAKAAGKGGLAQAVGAVTREVASQAGSLVFQEAAREVAEKNGLSLTELNIGLTAASVAGNLLVGSRIGQLGQSPVDPTGSDNIAGILNRGGSRISKIAGLPFDAVDLALNYQGLPSASGYQALFNGTAASLTVGHSAGASEVSTLSKLGIIPSGATAVSLPFGQITPNGVSVINGRWDLVNGGPLGSILNPGAVVVNTGAPSLSFGNHSFQTYINNWPSGL